MQSNGTRKSNFPGQSIIPIGSTLDFVSSGVNYKITVSDMVMAFGTTGSIGQVGDNADVPILDDQGAFKGIRNIAAGFGIAVIIDPSESVEISTDFTFDITGVALVDDPSASSAIFRSLVAGPGITIAGTPGEIQVSTSLAPTSTKTVLVSEKEDFPAAVSGVITLDDDTQYFLVDDVSVGLDRFQIGAGSVITGSDSGLISLTYTNTGAMFTGVGNSLKLEKIATICTSGSLFNIDGAGSGILQLLDMTIASAKDLGTASNLRGGQITNTAFGSVTTTGLAFAGSNGNFLVSDLIGGIDAGIMLDLGSSTFQSFSMSNSFPIIPAGATMLKGLANGANIDTGGFGTVVNVIQEGDGVPLDTIENDDTKWQFNLNNKIPDTRADCLLYITTPSTTTAHATPGTPVLLNGVFAEGSPSSKFTVDAAGKMTFTGIKSFKLPITVSYSQEPSSGTNKTLSLYVAINGVVDLNSKRTSQRDSGSPGSTTISWQYVFQPNDFLEIFVSNDTDSVNILTNSGSSRIN